MMKWMVPILPINYDVHRAFSVGEFLDIKQIAPFQIGDTVYVISTDKEEVGYFYYECTVDKVQVDLDDQLYFESYYQYTGQVELIEYLVRLKLVRKVYQPGMKDLTISQFGYTTIPSKPIRNIGEQKKLFEELEHVLANISSEEKSVELIQESTYSKNQQAFLEMFPIDQWHDVSLSSFVENSKLLVHELSEKFDLLDVIALKQEHGVYVSSVSRVSDIHSFFDQLKEDIHSFLHHEETQVIDQFPVFKLALQSFYHNTTMFTEDSLNQLRSLLEIEESDEVLANFKITELIRQGNPSLQDVDAYQLSCFILDKFNIKEKTEEKVVLMKQPFSYYSKEDEVEIERLLRKYRKMFITRINHFGGVDELKNLLNRIFGGKGAYLSGLTPMEKRRLNKHLEYYVLVEDTSLSYNLANTYMNVESNVHVVVYSFGSGIFMDKDLKRYFLSKFAYYDPSMEFCDTDIEKCDYITIDRNFIATFVDVLNKLNTIISENSKSGFYITRDMFFDVLSVDQNLLSDIIKYQVVPVIRMNEFDEKDLKEIEKLIDIITNC